MRIELRFIIVVMIVCFLVVPVNFSISSQQNTSEYNTPHCTGLQFIGTADQRINGRRINAKLGESIFQFGEDTATIIVSQHDKIELVNFSIANNNNKKTLIKIESEYKIFSIADAGGYKVTQPIGVKGGSVAGPFSIEIILPAISRKSRIPDNAFTVTQVDTDDNLIPECPPEVVKINFRKYPGGYPNYDINISVSDREISSTSPSQRNIAIGGNRIHAVWIETILRKYRNVFYSYANITPGRSLTWSKPMNVSQFTTQQIQAESVAISADEESVFIVWNVEVNCKGGMPLITDEDDDHHVFCVKGLVGKEGCWFVLPVDGTEKLVNYKSPNNKKSVETHIANMSQNDELDSWKPVVAVDSYGRPHITWQNTILFYQYRNSIAYFSCILWVFWEDGWKTVDGTEVVPYEFSSDFDNPAVIVSDKNDNYYSPSISIGTYCQCFGCKEYVAVGFHSGRVDTIGVKGRYIYEDGWSDLITKWYEKGQNVSVSVNDFVSSIYEKDGNIISNYGYVIDSSGKCSNPCVVIALDEEYHTKTHIVYERKGDIYYSTRCPPDYDFVNINISNNEGHSSNPSIALDEYYRPHILWTDETPGEETEIIYIHLDCAWLHGGE
jgi:hypothetical protein